MSQLPEELEPESEEDEWNPSESEEDEPMDLADFAPLSEFPPLVPLKAPASNSKTKTKLKHTNEILARSYL